MTYRHLIVACLFLLASPFVVSAHPGNTDSLGCHTCKTNCPSWGLSYSEYHCHNAKSSYQPEEPIRSHYGEYGTGYTEPWPDYQYGGSTYSEPSCPLHSTYNSLTDSCKCNYGYVVQGSSCVDGDSVCWSELGYNSSYDTISNQCECDYGYVIGSGGQCVSRNSYCTSKFGFNSEYDILSDSCKCRSGYVNDGSNRCVNADTQCMNEYGLFSHYDSPSKTCECDYGYELNYGQCVEIEEEESLSDEEFEAILNALQKPAPAKIPATAVIPTIAPKKIESEDTSAKKIAQPISPTSESTTTSTTTQSSPTIEETVEKKSWLRRFLEWIF